MASATRSEIECEFLRLSPEDQLSLLERLVHHVRLSVASKRDTWEAELSSMAADPEMQEELRQISKEFDATESDGLESVWDYEAHSTGGRLSA